MGACTRGRHGLPVVLLRDIKLCCSQRTSELNWNFIRPIITSTYYNLVYTIGQETSVKAFKCHYHESHLE